MSNLQRTPITDASDDQLRAFCDMQQIDTAACKTRADVLAALGPAWDHDYVFTIGAPEAAAALRQDDAVEPVAQQDLMIGAGRHDPVVVVKVGHTQYPGGDKPVPLSLNGSPVAVLQRNMLTRLPYRLYLVLKDAMSADTRPDKDSEGRERGTTDVEYTNYPIVHAELPPAAEIAAWHKRVDGKFCPA